MFLCSSCYNDYSEMLKFLRTLEKENILAIIPHQTGVIFKLYYYTVLFYRTDIT